MTERRADYLLPTPILGPKAGHQSLMACHKPRLNMCLDGANQTFQVKLVSEGLLPLAAVANSATFSWSVSPRLAGPAVHIA
jgi:hypothetical protein